MTKKYLIILTFICFYLVSFEQAFSQRVIKFSRIGQKETVKVGENYKIIYDNINPENSRIRYIPTAKDDEYILELTHYKGLEGDEWIDETLKKYETEILQLKKQISDLSDENNNLKTSPKHDAAANSTTNINSKKSNDSAALSNSLFERKDKEGFYNIFNLSPLQNEIDKNNKNLDFTDIKIDEKNKEFETNISKIKNKFDSLRSLGKGSGSGIKQAELEALLKRNIELVEEYNQLYKEKIRLLQDKHQQEEELDAQKRLRNIFIIISIFVFLIALMIYYFYRQKKLANKIVLIEQQKSEKLLLNILPEPIALRLKNNESMIADRFESASVIFIDISQFTEITRSTTPEKIVQMLNKVYIEFDHIALKFGLEKIKTIGDCYMAAAGLPVPNADHAVQCAKFALEAMKKIDHIDTGLGVKLRIRAGIDCGPIMAGIIGENKFIYDVYGDTVNTASRMEEYGTAGAIQITDRFKKSIEKNKDVNFKFEDKGDTDIKGLGMTKTWFLTSKS